MVKKYINKHIVSIFFLIVVNLFFFRTIFENNLSQSIIGGTGDPCLNSYILEYGYNKINRFELGDLFDANIIYPSKKPLAFSEHLLGHQLFYFVIRSISGDVLASYNILLIFNFLLCSIGFYFLGMYLFKSVFPSLFLAIVFSYSSSVIQQYAHFQIASLPWVGFVLLFLFLFLQTNRLKYGLLFLIFWLLQSMGSYYIGYILFIAISSVIIIHIFITKKYLDFKLWKNLFIIGFFFLLVMLPLSLPYLEVKQFYHFKRSLAQNVSFSAHFPLSFIMPSPLNQYFGFIFSKLHHLFPFGESQEKVLFMGFLGLGFVFYQFIYFRNNKNIIRPTEYRYAFWLAIIFFILSLGPIFNGLVIDGKIIFPLPYLLFYYIIPGFSSMRVPARFGIFFVLAMSIIASYGFKHFIDRLSKNKTKWIISYLVMIVLIIEFIPIVPMVQVKPVPLAIKYLPNDPSIKIVAYYPSRHRNPYVEGQYIYYSSYHLANIVNGFSGYKTKSNFYAKYMINGIDDSQLIDYLHRLGVSHIIALPDFMKPIEKIKLESALSKNDLIKVKTFKDGSYICAINKNRFNQKNKEIESVIKLKMLDDRYLIATVHSDGGGFYVSSRRDLFEQITIEIVDSNKDLLTKVTQKALIPAIIPKNNDILFKINLPDHLDVNKIAKIIVQFKSDNKKIITKMSDIIKISSINKSFPEKATNKIKLVSFKKNPLNLKTNSITTIKLKVVNNSSVTIPALGEGNVIYTEDNILIGLGLANSPGKYRIGFIGRWMDEKGKKVVQHDFISWIPFGTWMPKDLKPKKEMLLDVNVKVPERAGRYNLEIKMFQDLGFSKQGSKIARLNKTLKTLKILVQVK